MVTGGGKVLGSLGLDLDDIGATLPSLARQPVESVRLENLRQDIEVALSVSPNDRHRLLQNLVETDLQK